MFDDAMNDQLWDDTVTELPSFVDDSTGFVDDSTALEELSCLDPIPTFAMCAMLFEVATAHGTQLDAGFADEPATFSRTRSRSH